MKRSHIYKENLENIHIERFHQIYGIPGEIIPRTKNQVPDFLYRRKGSILGIEHSSLKMNHLKEKKGIQRQIVNRAKELAEKEGIPPLEVMVHFHNYYTRYPQKGTQQANLLFKTIKDHIEIIKNSPALVKINPPEPFCGIDGILVTYGNINDNQWLQNHRWSIDEIGWVRINFIEELKNRIEEKNKLINNYLQQCTSCWLLIVADRSKSDEQFIFTEEMRTYSYHSLFEKTFFMEPTEGDFIELTTHMFHVSEDGFI